MNANEFVEATEDFSKATANFFEQAGKCSILFDDLGLEFYNLRLSVLSILLESDKNLYDFYMNAIEEMGFQEFGEEVVSGYVAGLGQISNEEFNAIVDDYLISVERRKARINQLILGGILIIIVILVAIFTT